MDKNNRSIWITWERQVRNRSLAKAFNAQLFELDIDGGRFVRYLLLSIKTFRILVGNKSKIVFVQNPSLVLALQANILCKLLRKKLVVDSHNGGLFPVEGKSMVLNFIAKAIVRISPFTIVSNNALAKYVSSIGGKPLVLPDPLPEIEDIAPAFEAEEYVLFICTWATDEPYREVIQAASALGVTVYITGKVPLHVNREKSDIPENVILTGFLSDADYAALLRGADLVIDLTTREDCLVCGAYEAVAVGKPMVLSNTQALRSYFNLGAVYTDNSAVDIENSVKKALYEKDELTIQVAELKIELEKKWNEHFEKLKAELPLYN